VYLAVQERRSRIAQGLVRHFGMDVGSLRVLEIGCGSGGNLLELISLGFRPDHLVGNDLLPERAAVARQRLPAAVTVRDGNALELDFPQASLDIVYQSTVFSSILDADFRSALARRMWEWVRPGGAVLWYDLAFDNPSNRDVRGVKPAEIRRLFPAGKMQVQTVTLAPPISRRVAPFHPALYAFFNAIPVLRTHRLCWIIK
jgi:SAM-dependent methyltransferase